MANIVESETWDTGVYQLETTDPVQGGVDGIDNVPHKALANRTVWLKAQLALKALLGGDNTQIFKAADGLAADDVVTKGQLDLKETITDNDTKLALKVNTADLISTTHIIGSNVDLVRGLPADFTSSLATNGYQKLPSGLIIQWMYADNSTSGDITFTFPIAFPNALLFTAGQQTSDSGKDNTTISFNASTTQASFSRRRYDSANTAEAIFVIAIGY